MEIKQFITQTIETLADCSETDQVLIFNEIKAALLANRCKRQECITKQIEELQALNKAIYAGNSTINGEDSPLKVTPTDTDRIFNKGF